jgi:hypothetical protein
MEDVQAARSLPGKQCLLLFHRLDAAREGHAQFYQEVSPRERGALDFETEVELLAALDSASGSYWGRLRWV